MSVALRASELYRFFHTGDDETMALRGVSLEVAAGELVALVGPSGSGKSTLLACLAGLDDPDGGHVEVLGTPISRQPEALRCRMRARSIGIVLQAGNLFSHLSVLDNVHFQRRIAGLPPGRLAETLLEELGLGAQMTKLPTALSGGETVRAALAVALAAEPPILVCDEPTAEVDERTEANVIATLKEQQRRGAAILVATHSEALAGRADRIVRIADGRLE
jgi:putative ABC transport system ATP-binding protein